MSQTVYSPPVTTYTPLATITLSSTASQVIFSNIPQGYRDLVLVWNGKTTNLDYSIRGTINGDTGSNYSEVFMQGSSGGAISSTYATPYFFAGAPAGYTSTICILNFMDYSATDKHKIILTRGNQDGNSTLAFASRWANTTAINSIRLYAASDAWAIGTIVSLYGIAS